MRLSCTLGLLICFTGLTTLADAHAAPTKHKKKMGKHHGKVDEPVLMPLPSIKPTNPAVPPRTPITPPPEVTPTPEPETTPPPETNAMPPPTAPALPSPGLHIDTSSSSNAAPTPAAQPMAIPANDGTVSGSTKALADAVREAYAKTGMGTAFHRVAVPYFTEVGQQVSDHHLGKVVTELMAVELAKQPPFTVVERDHLDQVMKEYRLADLGVVDKTSAAQFGKMLGAQSIVSGTVSEAGPKYIVSVRLVDVESAQVLVAGSTDVQADGLVALSSEAVELRSKKSALLYSALIPGWGQFYNREPVKGAVFLGLGVATLGTAAGFYIASNMALNTYKGDTAAGVPYRNTANDRINVANGALVGYGVVWLVGMLDAYINGVDATSVHLQNAGMSTAGTTASFHFKF